MGIASVFNILTRILLKCFSQKRVPNPYINPVITRIYNLVNFDGIHLKDG